MKLHRHTAAVCGSTNRKQKNNVCFYSVTGWFLKIKSHQSKTSRNCSPCQQAKKYRSMSKDPTVIFQRKEWSQVCDLHPLWMTFSGAALCYEHFRCSYVTHGPPRWWIHVSIIYLQMTGWLTDEYFVLWHYCFCMIHVVDENILLICLSKHLFIEKLFKSRFVNNICVSLRL